MHVWLLKQDLFCLVTQCLDLCFSDYLAALQCGNLPAGKERKGKERKEGGGRRSTVREEEAIINVD